MSLKDGGFKDYKLKSLTNETTFESSGSVENFLFTQEIALIASKAMINNPTFFSDFLKNMSYTDVKRLAQEGSKITSLEVTEVHVEGNYTVLSLTNSGMLMELILDDTQGRITEMSYSGIVSDYTQVQQTIVVLIIFLG
jgi:hypothetical protein